MLKFKITGEPEEIEAYFLHIAKLEALSVQYRSEVSKYAAHNKTGSVVAGIHAEPVQGIEAKVSIYQRPTSKKRGQAQAGYVYLMPAYDGKGLIGYKIGKTIKPQSRRRTFGVKLSFEVKFLALISTGDHTGLETELHRRFADKRMGTSEFFNLTAFDVSHIVGMMSDADKKLLKEVNRD